MIKIIVKEENKPTRDFAVDKFPLTIGRSKDNTIRVPNPFLSREHCRIEQVGGTFQIVDLDSKNGLSVNGQPARSAAIKNGDVITIGNNTFTLVVEGEKKETPPPAATPEPRPAPAPATARPVNGGPVRPGAAPAKTPAPAGKPFTREQWDQQLSEEEITECTHCRTLFSISYRAPGVGFFCPSCKTKHD
ncbi:MAG: FHA domain-containing protein [Planctomycetota bacterium]